MTSAPETCSLECYKIVNDVGQCRGVPPIFSLFPIPNIKLLLTWWTKACPWPGSIVQTNPAASKVTSTGLEPTLLLEQRRMHSSIADFPNHMFYSGPLLHLVAKGLDQFGYVWGTIPIRFLHCRCATGQLMNAANDSALEAVPGFAWPNSAACLTGCQDMSRYAKVWSEKQWVIKSSLSGQILVERRKLYETIRFFLSPGFLGFLGLQSCLRGRLFWHHWGPKRVLHIQYRWGHWMPLDALIICFCCEDTWSLDQQWQAEAVASVLENIINAGYPPDQIVVLTAYLAQKQAQKVPNIFSSRVWGARSDVSSVSTTVFGAHHV